MNETGTAGAATAAGVSPSAGTLLRTARQAQGLHIAALSASIKVSQRKLELLEADRLSELPDATFARALAQTICRSLKIDPTPVLAALPQAPGYRLEAVDGGMKTPFRDRPGRHDPAHAFALGAPAVWVAALIAAAALLVLLLPAEWAASVQALISGPPPVSTQAMPAPAGAEVAPASSAPDGAVPADAAFLPIETASAVTGEGSASAVSVDPAASAASGVTSATAATTTAPIAVSPSATSSAAAVGPLQLKASAETWVEVVDGESKVLVSRMLLGGEVLVLNGAPPFKLKIGNAAATEVAFQGQPVSLAASTLANVARLELK